MLENHSIRHLTIIAVCLLAFYNGIENGFTFDDHLAIEGNADTFPVHVVSEQGSGLPMRPVSAGIWGNDIWGKNLLAEDSHRSYRPLLILLFRTLRTFHDSPQCLRVVSILLHTIVSCCVYHIGLACNSRASRDVESFGAALLYALHPVHVEAVTAVVNTAESAHAIFWLAALHIYITSMNASSQKWKGCLIKQKNDNSEIKESLVSNGGAGLPVLFPVISVFCSICVGTLFKETAITFYGLVLVHAGLDFLMVLYAMTRKYMTISAARTWLCVHGVWVSTAVLFIMTYTTFRIVLLSPVSARETLLKLFSSLLQIPAHGIASFREQTSSTYLEKSDLLRRTENPFTFLPDMSTKIMSFMYLHWRYMLVLLWPAELSAEYAFDCISSVKTIVSVEFALAAMLYLCILGLLAIGTRTYIMKFISNADVSSDESQTGKELVWFTFMMIVPFVPATGLFLRLGTLLAERLLYVPSIGFCLLVAHILSLAITKLSRLANFEESSPKRWCKIYWVIILMICSLYFAKTREQNFAWYDDETLFTNVLKTCPRSAKAYLQIAKLHVNRGDFAIAEDLLKQAKYIDPEFCDIQHQEALLHVMYKNDIKSGINSCAENLSCAYTAFNCLELLQKLFAIELQAAEGHYARARILESHGDVFLVASLPTLATQKYLEATYSSIQGGDVLFMSSLVQKLEESREQWSNETNSLNTPHLLSYGDKVKFLGGVIRLNLQQTVELGKLSLADIPRDTRNTLSIGKRLLFELVYEWVQMTDLERTKLLNEPENVHLLAAARLVRYLSPKVENQLKVIKRSEQKKCSDMTAAAHVMDLASLMELAIQNEQIRDLLSNDVDMDTRANLWLVTANTRLKAGDPKLASKFFNLAIKAGLSGEEYCHIIFKRAQAIMKSANGTDNRGETAEATRLLMSLFNPTSSRKCPEELMNATRIQLMSLVRSIEQDEGKFKGTV